MGFDSAVLTMDWKTKFQFMMHSESMVDFSGKKGFCWGSRHRRRVAHAPEGVVPAAVFEPSGRNDLLRRVRKDFDGEPLVLPPCPTKAKSKGKRRGWRGQ
mmetsp:Transcript_48544/g.136417  ORF Transcript_48544/g.136417 Transcript_48544/m.136417 type:complete len:100 (+) Transcript_48544:521-820(+)